MNLRFIFLYSFLYALPFATNAREINWDWSMINPNNIWFPKNFLWGCVDSALQTEGIVTAGGKTIKNSWTEFEKTLYPDRGVGVACERWTRYKEDFALLKDIGMNAYRFSVDWSKIEPQQGVFDQEAMQHYIDVVDELLSRGITPMLCVFHHACPLWFMQKKGFEKKDNIKYFVEYATYLFRHLHNKVKFWIIFNEPVAYAFEGYFRGKYPPGKNSLSLAGKVILNQLNAHVETALEYRNIDRKAKIGIAHFCHPLDAYGRWNLFEKAVCKWFSRLLNDTTIEFFKTGKFRWTPPWVRGTNKKAPETLDFFGVNYYTHTTIKQTGLLSMEAAIRPEDKVVDKSERAERSKVMYPEGMYRSIVRASKLNIPIYITENGAATSDLVLKDEYIRKHLYVVSRAISEGYDVRGYFFWTLTDCFSWNKGYENKHGIFAVDFETQERTFRPATQYLVDTVKRFRGIS
jgi:beta-glucosidase